MDIKNIAVIGAGVMGTGITQLLTTHGYEVNLADLEQKILNNAKDLIEKNLERHYVARDKLSKEKAKKILNSITLYLDHKEAVKNVDLVIEAVSEDMDLKKNLFAEFDEICEPNIILASNTSSLSISEIASKSEHQERIIGIHFFNPAPVMKLIELIQGVKTSEATLDVAKIFSLGLGKKVVVCKDSPGFITSRLIYVMCNEAIKMKKEGLASTEDIDIACKMAFNFPMGPLELSDLVGLDVYQRIGEYLATEFGEFYKPSVLINQMVQKDNLGRKSNKGFYDYK